MHLIVCKTLFLALLFYVLCDAYNINKVDFKVEQFKKHHTDEFYANENGSSKVIFRRGDNFTFDVELFRHLRTVNIDVELIFVTKLDKMVINLPSNSSNGWRISQTSRKRVKNVFIHIPGNAPVGIWQMNIKLKNKVGNIIEEYSVPEQIVVLFNAWSSEDSAYFRETNKLTEYVLSESGHVYFYNWRTWSYRPWIFGQFQPQILDAILFVMDKSELSSVERGDIVKVARSLTHLMNDGGDNYPGVLRGRWQEPYDDGLYGHETTNPSEWTGSADILRKYYMNNGTAVGYGQCWVFAGILTTAYRALGIASRPVGNFASAHDEKNDLTADTYLDKNGNVNLRKSDTLWNFHEWTEAWFKREDLGMTEAEWQELDATPQAFHQGYLQVGPASISRIYNSDVTSNYETLYLYSEVNADEVVWSHKNKVLQINRHKVGLAVKTKAFGSDDTEDITLNYKPKEKTLSERLSYKLAASKLRKTPVSLTTDYTERSLFKKFSISISMSKSMHVGQAIGVEIFLKNRGIKKKELTLSVKASSIYYNGQLKSEIKNDTTKLTLKAFEKRKVVFTIETNEYIRHLANQRTIFIDASAMINDDVYHVSQRFTLGAPKLQIEVPETVQRKSLFTAIVKLKNPLNETLKNCRITVEGKGFPRTVFLIDDVPAVGVSNTSLILSTTRLLSETFVFNFHTDALKESVGSAKLHVKGVGRRLFNSYRRRNTTIGFFASATNTASSISASNTFQCCEQIHF